MVPQPFADVLCQFSSCKGCKRCRAPTSPPQCAEPKRQRVVSPSGSRASERPRAQLPRPEQPRPSGRAKKHRFKPQQKPQQQQPLLSETEKVIAWATLSAQGWVCRLRQHNQPTWTYPPLNVKFTENQVLSRWSARSLGVMGA